MGNNSRNQKNAPFIRNQYYPGKLLHASDFVREQEYGKRKLEFVNRKFHGCGMIDGMEIREEQNGEWYVTAGSALDSDGRLLVLPEDRRVDFPALEGIPAESGRDFVLGIQYAEQVMERERSFLEGEESYQAASIAESIAFRAYSPEEWRRLKAETGRETKLLTEERLLYENEEIELTLRVPKLVPSDSIFCFSIQARAAEGKGACIDWRGLAKLQGANFLESGSNEMLLEEKQAVLSGRLQWEWKICTDEGRSLPVLLELGPLELLQEGTVAARTETLQVYIETAKSYTDAAKKYLAEKESAEPAEAWLPLARFRAEDIEDSAGRFRLLSDFDVRFRAFDPQETEMLRRAAEENGIVDISWRSLLKSCLPSLPQPETPAPEPPLPEQLQGLIGEEWEKRVRRGVAVIPVPKRYRRGQVLFSEEISHGFSGEEVLLWCGRLRKDRFPVYWEHDERQYSVISGQESLFPENGDCGWEIEKQALRQNVGAGTFQIALTLSKGRRRKRIEEVAVLWIAVRSV